MTRHLYLAPLPQFLDDVMEPEFADRLSAKLEEVGSGGPAKAEIDAWRRSLKALADTLRHRELEGAAIFVELFMPLNNQRCDALLTGRNAAGPAAVVVELKQWSFIRPSALEEHVLVGGQSRVHPSIQVRDYVETLRHFHSAFTGEGEPISLSGAAFLHDMDPRNGSYLRDPHFGGAHLDFPMFFANERAAFARWLAGRLVPGPGLPVAQRIVEGRPMPSPKLLDLVVQTVKGTHAWRLIDRQKTAHFAIRNAVVTARDKGEKKVIIVRGAPGTGKSVIAIQLLADAARAGWAVAHASGTKAFQTVLQGITTAFADQQLKAIHNVKTKKALPIKHLFTTFSEIARAGTKAPDGLDLTICDEAHRLWEVRQSKYGHRVIPLSDKPMVQEVIAASRVTAFFLDENQSVRSGEIGHSDLIVEHARAMGVEVQRFELDAQFRCSGSESYVRWVDAVLGLRANLDLEWREHGVYRTLVWDDASRLDRHLRDLRAGGQRCRWIAGFCWRWNEPDGLHQLPLDVQDPRFGPWSAPWIEKGPQDASPLEHRYYRWATQESDDTYRQVGSIYSVQGFEFDAVGVIWGEDLVRRGSKWVAQLDRNKDNAFKQELRKTGEDPVAKLLNIYRVLLTRGMRETNLFVLDDETRQYLRACLEYQQATPLAVGAPNLRVAAKPPPGLHVVRASESIAARSDRAHAFSPYAVVAGGADPWKHGVPVLDLAAAAGDFGAERPDPVELARSEEWISWEGAPRFHPGMFVSRVFGRSMEPMIPDGAWCLFRLAPAPQGGARTMLVQLMDPGQDSSRFTVKDVKAEWRENGSGMQECVALVLTPRNKAYPELRLEAGAQPVEVHAVAELVQVLGLT